MKRIQDTLHGLWDNIQCTNIRIIGVPEEEEKKKGTEKIFEEIIAENFPNIGNEIKSRKHIESNRRINPRKNMPRHILIKPSKIKYKEKTIKSPKGKATNSIQGITIRLTADHSAETVKTRRE